MQSIILLALSKTLFRYYLSQIWVPYFFRENGIKKYLQDLYDGLVNSSENARIIVNHEVEDLKMEDYGGNPLSKNRYAAAIRWLKYLQEFSMDKQTFADQFLEPARSAARFRLKIHEEIPNSMELICLVFRKSKPFYDQFRESVVLSMIVPELNTALSMRCKPEEAEKISFGFCKIQGVQPIPYVNRIHPCRLKIEAYNKPVRLTEFNFCKISFRDINSVGNTLAFEESCEMLSENIAGDFGSYHGRRLGFTRVLIGKVLLAGTGPNIVIQDPCNQDSSIELYVTEQFLKLLHTDLAGLSMIKGKFLRVLAVFWYRFGSSQSMPEIPEAIIPELVTNKTEPIMDDLIGFIRNREKVPLESLVERYPDIDLLPIVSPLEKNNRELIFKHVTPTQNRIGQFFAEEKAIIRNKRKKLFEKTGKGQIDSVEPFKVLAIDRLSEKGLIDWVRNNQPLLRSLIDFLRIRDFDGELPSKRKKIMEIIKPSATLSTADILNWLRQLDFIVKQKGGPIRITERGIKIAYLSIKPELDYSVKQLIHENGFLDLSDAQNFPLASPSLILKILNELEITKIIQPIMINGQPFPIFWSRFNENNQYSKMAEDRLRFLEKKILGVLNSVSYSIHTLAVLERSRKNDENFSMPVVKIILKNLGRQGKISSDTEGRWFYPLENRVLEVFKENPYVLLSEQQIASKTNSTTEADHDRILELINQLYKKGVIFGDSHGKWAILLERKEARRPNAKDSIFQL